MNKYTSILAFLFCLALSYRCDAQSGSRKKAVQDTYDFVPGENVVFYDDFSGYKEGTYPERWEILSDHIDATTDEWEVVKASVTKLDNVWCLYFKKGNHRFGMPHWDTTNYTALYKDNYWSIEFDFRFIIIKNNSANDISIFIGADWTSYEDIGFDRDWATKDSQS